MNGLSRKTIDRQQIQQAEQIIYDYLLQSVQSQSSEQVLDIFRRLFIEGRSTEDASVYFALEKIVKSKDTQENFNYFFNRCCYIVINRWQMQPHSQLLIPEMVRLFENLSPGFNGYPTTANILRRLVINFTKDERYLKLQRLGRVMNGKPNSASSVGNLIHRYPYLYDHCLLSENSSSEDQKTIQRIKTQLEHGFEINLSKYVTYQVRLAQTARNSNLSTIIRPVDNPTLLSDRELNRALTHYIGPVEGGATYKDISRNFLNHSSYAPTYKSFKDELYEYILGSVDPKYGKGQFNKKLFQHLQNTLPQFDTQKPNEFLIMRTSSQLFNFLVVDSAHKPDHYVFIDLITNMGVTRTIGLLLKIALMSAKVKPYLEKRFSILFNHYESFTKDGVPWLVKTLESLHVAFSVHFGKADVSCLKQLQAR
jgi:hypothetical protein